jgi:hypothetical protein
MKKKLLTHKQAVIRMLKNPEVKSEVERLNKEEFAIFEETLQEPRDAGLSQAEMTGRMGV